MRKLILVLGISLSLIFSGGTCLAKDVATKNGPVVEKSMGQTLYLPIAHMDHSYDAADGTRIFQRIFNRISFRNTDPNNQITITALKIFDPDGQLVRELISSPTTLGPLASTSYGMPTDIPFSDGGSGSNGRYSALLTWQANDYVTQPNIATAMVWAVRENNGWKYTAFENIKGKIIE